MKIKEFTAFSLMPEEALKLLSAKINSFLKGDSSIAVVSLSHSIIDSESPGNEKFIASALMCYR